jgi:hypothetical protein
MAILLIVQFIRGYDTCFNVIIRVIFSIIVGALLCIGLAMSGFTQREKVKGFLTIGDKWNCSIGVALGIAILLNILIFWIILRRNVTPVFGDAIDDVPLIDVE